MTTLLSFLLYSDEAYPWSEGARAWFECRPDLKTHVHSPSMPGYPNLQHQSKITSVGVMLRSAVYLDTSRQASCKGRRTVVCPYSWWLGQANEDHSLVRCVMPSFHCCCSVAQSCPTLCEPMNCSTLSFLVLLYLLEFALTDVHWVNDAIQPSHPLLPSSPPLVFSLSQHQGISHELARVLRK